MNAFKENENDDLQSVVRDIVIVLQHLDRRIDRLEEDVRKILENEGAVR